MRVPNTYEKEGVGVMAVAKEWVCVAAAPAAGDCGDTCQ